VSALFHQPKFESESLFCRPKPVEREITSSHHIVHSHAHRNISLITKHSIPEASTCNNYFAENSSSRESFNIPFTFRVWCRPQMLLNLQRRTPSSSSRETRDEHLAICAKVSLRVLFARNVLTVSFRLVFSTELTLWRFYFASKCLNT
jgi:hypothetical protein